MTDARRYAVWPDPRSIQGHEPIQGSSIEYLQSREVDRQSPTGLIFIRFNSADIGVFSVM